MRKMALVTCIVLAVSLVIGTADQCLAGRKGKEGKKEDKCPLTAALKQLNLTEEQDAQIKEICEEPACTGKAPADADKKEWTAKKKGCMKQIKAVLTDEQREKFDALMKGKGEKKGGGKEDQQGGKKKGKGKKQAEEEDWEE
jgi:Spy/CpxP family protein refolding chaperone